jgi:hypothetical protein
MQHSGEKKPKRARRVWGKPSGIVALSLLGYAGLLCAQASQERQPPTTASPAAPSSGTDSTPSGPIAIVTVNGTDANINPTVNGALEISDGKALIMASGSITARDRTTTVVLPHRGTLRVCASTTVKLAAGSTQPSGDAPGLLMALDHGALETSYATGQNADMILTPHFRILIGGPGASELKVRLGDDGDTCVDNAGANAPYVVVTSLFEDGLYRVQPGQRVMFQHGSLRQVVDNEPEPCGCPPPPANAGGNEFPLAQSEGLAPTPAIAPTPAQPANLSPATTVPLVHNSNPAATQTAPAPEATAPAPAGPAVQSAPAAAPPKRKPGLFKRIANFLKKIFGAE